MRVQYAEGDLSAQKALEEVKRWQNGDSGELLKCSFCGKSQKQVKKLIAGPGVYICDECIDLCNEIIEEELSESTEISFDNLPSHEKFQSFSMSMRLGKTTQRRFCRSRCTTIIGVFNISSHRLASDAATKSTDEVECVAPRTTGCGKTHLAQTLARMLNVPFAVADATALTEAGYVGEDVENILLKLLQAADFDTKRAETGIIYIDEIDKVAEKRESVDYPRCFG